MANQRKLVWDCSTSIPGSTKGQVLRPVSQSRKLLAHDAEVPEHTLDAPMDSTTEAQLSGNSQEASRDSYLEAMEELEAFFQELNDTYGTETSAAPEAELCAPLTAHEEDNQKEPMQNQKPTAEDLVQLSGNSKEASMTSYFPTLEDIEEFLQEVNETYRTRIPAAPESDLCVPLTAHDDVSQKESLQKQVTSFDERNPAAASQLMDVTDTLKTFISDCQATAVNANKLTVPSENSQMKTLSDDQSLYGGQMAFSGVQTTYLGQMKKLSDEDTPHRVYMMPLSSASLLYPRILYVASSHLIQGQPVETQKWNPKIQRCPLQKRPDILRPYICTYKNCGKAYAKSSHLRIHERVHTGEKPYKCNVNGCTWAFSRSSELNRHKKRHTRERPYLCTICDKDFARRDHLKQHQRVHR
ncbi:Kruppel-like factor 18 isoform X1 [Bubalus kerabau]|uniref:Kruppel-like factor 18 isoform X1 n=1 Tax=Bubalus carabanensis TaxID=3119969 RepID=UPI00244EAF3E|nr:Kruppel-like factor 18 isoform X1 [Bubalus carabanensis]